MALLKRIKASTLMETLVGTALIVLLFALSSTILNSMFANSIRFNRQDIVEHLHELQYQYQHAQITLPYKSDFESWEMHVYQEQRGGMPVIVFTAKDSNSGKEVIKTMSYAP
ncbi:hypothetical protein [Poritiphilus flavus]|uniref:Type II secretion system protein n=1 Tax=Poritiphilus flavus TaxID=2697053 RepID=A0A6L9EE35_9FLAO|nr:hypothetical protein [Poritiphilus flavus]NAS12913.1 hypothetical protein [Poritiphilus flavus]